jgi:hypothetical protein
VMPRILASFMALPASLIASCFFMGWIIVDLRKLYRPFNFVGITLLDRLVVYTHIRSDLECKKLKDKT